MNKQEELLSTIQNLRLAKAKIDESYDNQIEALTAKLSMMVGDEGLKIDIATAYWQKHTEVKVGDWNALMEYVAKNNAFDVLQKRVSPAQLQARIKAGAVIKGVTITEGSKTLVIKGNKSEE